MTFAGGGGGGGGRAPAAGAIPALAAPAHAPALAPTMAAQDQGRVAQIGQPRPHEPAPAVRALLGSRRGSMVFAFFLLAVVGGLELLGSEMSAVLRLSSVVSMLDAEAGAVVDTSHHAASMSHDSAHTVGAEAEEPDGNRTLFTVAYCTYRQEERIHEPNREAEFMAKFFAEHVFPDRKVRVVPVTALPRMLPKHVSPRAPRASRRSALLEWTCECACLAAPTRYR